MKLLKSEKSYKKRIFDLLQLLVLGALFAVALNKEIVLFIKNFIDSLPIGSDFIRSIAIEVYIGLKVIIYTQSLVSVLLLCLELFYVTYDLYIIFTFNYKWIQDDSSVQCMEVQSVSLNDYTVSNRYCYLNLSRLLN